MARDPREFKTSNPRQKRAWTGARHGRIERGGDRRWAGGLADALLAASADDATEEYTHRLHSYPARMHPSTARALVALLANDLRSRHATILDPFCGSGTTLVEASAAGFDAIGVDLNPLAVRLARTKTAKLLPAQRKLLQRTARDITGRTLAEGKAARRAGYTAAPPFTPRGVDQTVRDRALHGWFASHVRRELEFIAKEIEDAAVADPVRDALWICLSALLIKSSRRTSETDSRRRERTIGRGQPARWFRERVELLVAGLGQIGKIRSGPGRVQVVPGDARRLVASNVAQDSIAGVITSPPYAGTYDYSDHHVVRAAFLGLSTASMKSEIGARRKPSLPKTKKDLHQVFSSLAEVTHVGAPMVVMLGDSLSGYTAVMADELLQSVLPSQIELIAWAKQSRAKLGARERDAFGTRSKHEHLFLLRNVGD